MALRALQQSPHSYTIPETARWRFLYKHLNLPEASGIDEARWEHFQYAHLIDNSVLRIEDKSRQIAWSFLTAAEAVASAFTEKRDSVFVSINLDEAKEKIRYAKYIYNSLKVRGLPALIRDASQNLEFSNGVRLTSLPAKPPRGRARANVYLDEFAHIADAEEIYTAAMPILSKGGRLRIGSSPFGASGKFWEIFTQSMHPYPGFTRKTTPWWEVWSFCKNVPQARLQCPKLTTRDSVEIFGNERLLFIFENMVLEDFEQEYCGIFNDMSLSWFSYEEISGVQVRDLLSERVTCRGKEIGDALAAIIRLHQYMEESRVEPRFALGMDIGRTHDSTDLVLIGLPTDGLSFPLRLRITLQGVEFDDQFQILTDCMDILPVARTLIDRSGIGMQLAENANKVWPDRAFGVDFSTASKILWATSAKKYMQQKKTPIPVDRDLAYQLNAIKRINTGAILRFDADRSDTGHADTAWAWMLAIEAAKQLTFGGMKRELRSISARQFA